MAAWQFDVEFLPARWALSDQGQRAALTDAQGYSDTAPAWRDEHGAMPLVHEALRAEFGEPSQLLSTYAQWGSETADRFDVANEGDLIGAFYVRISASVATEASLARILRLADATRCVLWPRGAPHWLEPTASALAQAVSSSSAAEFGVPFRREVSGNGPDG